MWIDSHSHLNDEAFTEDYPAVIQRALEGGVEAMIVVGCDLPSSRRAVELASQYEQLWAAVGIHPHDAKSWNEDTVAILTEMLSQPKVVAMGEIGLDYHYLYSTKEEQWVAFQDQLSLAREYGVPVIIHNREAHQDTLNLLKQVKLGPAGGVMHCFSGSREVAGEWLRLGLHISFAGPLTFANAAKLREVAVDIPLERLLVETDCPYLAPVPCRGQRNEPLRVGLIGEKLAEIRGLPVADVMRQTNLNTRGLFTLTT
jgi:TatD DNase family protein